MASIWSSHVLPSLPLAALESLPAEECLPPDLPTLPSRLLLSLAGLVHAPPRVSLAQEKGLG